jgi:hypothetical protein
MDIQHHQSSITNSYTFQENNDDFFIIIKGEKYPMIHFLKASNESFPKDDDIPLSNRNSDDFFRKIQEYSIRKLSVDLIIISKAVSKHRIDYIESKCNELFDDIRLFVFDYEEVLFNTIQLNINRGDITIQDDVNMFRLNDVNWLEVSV